MNLKEDVKVEWVKSKYGDYCHACGSVKQKEKHKTNCSYLKKQSRHER